MKFSNYEKWDVHHHINPKFYIDELKKLGITKVFSLKQPKWTEEIQLKMMKKYNITKAFISISTPGVYFDNDDHSRKLSRRCNEYMANIIKKNPEKFGGFATVPLPDVDGAISELKYSLDILRLDGIGLLSNVKGKYLGSKEYRSFFEELNKRNATVFIHPTVPPTKVDHRILNYLYLFKLETTRTLIDFIRSGYHRDFPNIKFILSHGGGILPAIAPTLIESFKEENPNIEAEFKDFKEQIYLDTALTTYHEMIPAVIDFAGINHVFYGTDFIWAKKSYGYFTRLLSSLNIKQAYLKDIFKNNAERALKSKKPIENISIDSITTVKNNSNKIKYHYHCTPAKIIEQIKRIYPSFNDNKVEPWDINKALCWMDKTNYEKIMLSLDIPQLWNLKNGNITKILRAYNESAAKIRNENPQRIGAFGAIDVENPEQALKEIDYCMNDLKLDGICIYIRLYNSNLEDLFDERILDKLAKIGVPILVHPKDSRGIPVINENYLDSVYFIAKMIYLDKFKYLKDSDYILTHTGGLIPFLSRPIGTLYYTTLYRSRIIQFIFDWLITKDEKGHEYLKRIVVDD